MKKVNEEMLTVKKNITVIYNDGTEEQYKAIKITDTGVIIGQMKGEEFTPYGFIPKYNYKQLVQQR